MAQSNLAVIQDFYEALGKGDAPGALALMDEGIVWTEADNFVYADRNPYVGPAAIGEGIFGRFGAEWDGFAATPEKFLDAGESVVVTGRYTGTYKKTGKSINAQFAHVYGLSGGKITSLQQYTDTAQVRDAVTE